MANNGPRLSFGMAVASDWDGVYFTIQALRLFHGGELDGAEILVVDNQPWTEAGKRVADFVTNWVPNARYLAHPVPFGTTQSRQRIFDDARGDVVVVCDPHVLFAPGSIRALRAWFAERPTGSLDLVSGPLWHDSLSPDAVETHFDDQWRGGMRGTWGFAWRCPCGRLRFGVHEKQGEVVLALGQSTPVFVGFHALLGPGIVPVTRCPSCGPLPDALPWRGHQIALRALGYRGLADDPDAPAFEIPAQGLGVFACQRATWPGFNPHFRGFGGEEVYIHNKTRQRGGRVWCLPALRWVHRFGRVGAVPYRLDTYDKVRNNVLGANELGESVDPIAAHFVGPAQPGAVSRLTREQWDWLIGDPIAREFPPTTPEECGTCGGGGRPQPPNELHSLAELAAWVAGQPRDLDQHVEKLVQLASQCGEVVEFAKRRESTVALAAGVALYVAANGAGGKVLSFNVETDPLLSRVVDGGKAAGVDVQIELRKSDTVATIPPCDLLFLDSEHTAAAVLGELRRYGPVVRRWIVAHDTQLHGETGEDGGPGLLAGIRQWLRDNLEWSVVFHTQTQYGLTVLGRERNDKPALPGLLEQAGNLAATVAAHVADGLAKVDPAQLRARLDVCLMCSQRVVDRCAVCGCYLSAKAPMRIAECPLGNWLRVDAAAASDKGET